MGYRPVRVSLAKKKMTNRAGEIEEARLVGVLKLSCRLLEGSFLHVGAGRTMLRVSEEVKRLVARSRSLRDVVNELRRRPHLVEYEYAGLVEYGGRVCIPGSTLKGTCRARLELSVVGKEGSVPIGFRQAERPLLSQPQPGKHGWRHFRIWAPATWEDRGMDCNPASTEDYRLCAACDIFGAPGVASRVFFGNMYAEGVQLYRLTLDHNEKVVAVPPGTVFRGEVSFRFLRPYELGLILVGFGAREDGGFVPVLVGKSKYRKRRIKASDPDDEWAGREVRFGAVVFSADELKLLDLPGVPSWVKEGEREGLFYVLKGGALRERVAALVREARERVPGLRVGFSELEELEKLEGGGVG